jgi:ethanolamine ammonia-lyase large subunit
LQTRLFGKTYCFKSVKDVLARVNEARSGDELAGIAARTERERVAAKIVLADPRSKICVEIQSSRTSAMK